MLRLLAAVGLAALLTVACKGPTDPSDNRIESFTATVNPRDLNLQSFNVDNTGEINIKLTALSPGNVFIGVLYGQNISGACQPAQTNSFVSSSQIGRTIISGQIFIRGAYCLVVFDPVGVSTSTPWPAPQTYTIEVSHP